MQQFVSVVSACQKLKCIKYFNVSCTDENAQESSRKKWKKHSWYFFFTMLAGLEKSSSLIFCDRINFRVLVLETSSFLLPWNCITLPDKVLLPYLEWKSRSIGSKSQQFSNILLVYCLRSFDRHAFFLAKMKWHYGHYKGNSVPSLK